MKTRIVIFLILFLFISWAVFAEELTYDNEEPTDAATTIDTGMDASQSIVYGTCDFPLQNYKCYDTVQTACPDDNLQYVKGWCGGGNNVQCCAPPDTPEGKRTGGPGIPRKHFIDNAGVQYYDLGNTDPKDAFLFGDEVDNTLSLLEKNAGTIVIIQTENQIDGSPTTFMNKLYKDYNLGKEGSRLNMLIVFETGTNLLHFKGSCQLYNENVRNIFLDKNKEAFDDAYYAEAFINSANDLYDYITQNADSITCYDADLLAAGEKYLLDSASADSSPNWEYARDTISQSTKELARVVAEKTGTDEQTVIDAIDYASREEWRQQVVQELSKDILNLQDAIDNSAKNNAFLSTEPQCSADTLGQYACIYVASKGYYDLRPCVRSVTETKNPENIVKYIWEDDCSTFGGIVGSDKCKKYQNSQSCQSDCYTLGFTNNNCALPDKNLVEYGEDNFLKYLQESANREKLNVVKAGLQEIIDCYNAGTDLKKIQDSPFLCTGEQPSIRDAELASIDPPGVARIKKAFNSNAMLLTLTEIESNWDEYQTVAPSNRLCAAAVAVATRINVENPQLYDKETKLNAYRVMSDMCRLSGDPEMQSNVEVAEENIKQLSESSTFMEGIGIGINSLAEPANLKILGGTIVVSAVLPGVGTAIGGNTLTAAIRAATITRGVNALTTVYFSVQMGVGLYDTLPLCIKAGVNSKECGEATVQGAMLAMLVSHQVSNVNEIATGIERADIAANFESNLNNAETKLTFERDLWGETLRRGLGNQALIEKRIDEIDRELRQIKAAREQPLAMEVARTSTKFTEKALKRMGDDMLEKADLASGEQENLLGFFSRLKEAIKRSNEELALGDPHPKVTYSGPVYGRIIFVDDTRSLGDAYWNRANGRIVIFRAAASNYRARFAVNHESSHAVWCALDPAKRTEIRKTFDREIGYNTWADIEIRNRWHPRDYFYRTYTETSGASLVLLERDLVVDEFLASSTELFPIISDDLQRIVPDTYNLMVQNGFGDVRKTLGDLQRNSFVYDAARETEYLTDLYLESSCNTQQPPETVPDPKSIEKVFKEAFAKEKLPVLFKDINPADETLLHSLFSGTLEASPVLKEVISRSGITNIDPSLGFTVELLGEGEYKRAYLVRAKSLTEEGNFVIKIGKNPDSITENEFYLSKQLEGKNIMPRQLTDEPVYINLNQLTNGEESPPLPGTDTRGQLVLFEEYLPGTTLGNLASLPTLESVKGYDTSFVRSQLAYTIDSVRRYLPDYNLFKDLPSDLSRDPGTLALVEQFEKDLVHARGDLDGKLWEGTVRLDENGNPTGFAASDSNLQNTQVYVKDGHLEMKYIEFHRESDITESTEFNRFFANGYFGLVRYYTIYEVPIYEGSMVDYLEGIYPHLGNSQSATRLILGLRDSLPQLAESNGIQVDWVNNEINSIDTFLARQGVEVPQ